MCYIRDNSGYISSIPLEWQVRDQVQVQCYKYVYYSPPPFAPMLLGIQGFLFIDMVAAQEQPFMWIFKDLNRKSCTKGTICVIVLVFIFSAAKLSTDNSQRDNSPKYAAEGQIQDFVCSSSGSSNHREAKKGRRKQIHKPASVPYQSLQGEVVFCSFISYVS